MNYIHLAIPVFFLLIGLELALARIVEKDYYRLTDSINDLSCGIIQQVLDVFLKTVLFAGYLYLYGHYRLFTLPTRSLPTWVAGFLGVDLLYYWFHRWSHEMNAGWAAHIVHHQSEEYNLAVALRQGAFQGSFSWVFYLPLALLGLPPLVFLTVSSFNTLYQFWIHTRTIGRLGPLEWVLNTPSHHRVHHGRNPKYIDRNHGGTLIVWDRLFGTFQGEEEEPVYGITTPLGSWNPIWANLHYWIDLFAKARRARRLRDSLRLFLKPPGWHPEELGGFMAAPEVHPATYHKYDPPTPLGLRLYVLGQFVLVNLAAVAFLFRESEMGALPRSAAGLGIVVTLAGLGGLLDRRAWAYRLEAVRLVGLAALAAALLPAPAWAAAGTALALATLAWLLAYRRAFAPASTAPARAA